MVRAATGMRDALCSGRPSGHGNQTIAPVRPQDARKNSGGAHTGDAAGSTRAMNSYRG